MPRDNEDLVADSEDELPLPPKPALSSINDFTANKSIAPSNISAFSPSEQGNTSAIVSFNEIVPAPAVKPRPKPRPTYKASASTISSIEPVPKPRTVSSIVDFSQPDAPLSIADRAKSRIRKPTQKPSATTSSMASDIIDILTDSEDELQLLLPSRSKSNSKRKVDNSMKPNHVIEIPDTQPTLPVATSDLHPLPPSTSSQLPPSDPISTPESAHNQKRKRKSASPQLSPLPPVRGHKRKRGNRIEDDEYDSLMMPPPAIPLLEPPAFFASSSPPALPAAITSELPSENAKGGQHKRAKKVTKKNVEDDDYDESRVPMKKKKPVTRPRRKKGVEDDGQASATAQSALAFKSAEFIEDSDRESDNTPLVPTVSGSSSKDETKMGEVVISRKRQTYDSNLGDDEKIAKKVKKRPNKRKDEDEAEYGGDTAEEKAEPIKPKAKKPRASGRRAKGKGKQSQVLSEDEDARQSVSKPNGNANDHAFEDPIPIGEPKADESAGGIRQAEPSAKEDAVKENPHHLQDERRPRSNSNAPSSSPKTGTPSASSFARLNYRHSIASAAKPTSMSDLIRKVNSLPGSPHPFSSGARIHSPMLKSSRSALRKIAPLHPNRRTPPPLPPKPPAPKKTKKQLAMEEKWEEELEDTIEGWACLTTTERDLLRKAKWDKEMGWED